jgi:hypothetical protein
MPESLSERVERGAALLDERRPGWWDEVNVESLSFDDGERCVLGQLWGAYKAGKAQLSIDGRGAGDLGFVGFLFDAASPKDLWRAAIERRRAAEVRDA